MNAPRPQAIQMASAPAAMPRGDCSTKMVARRVVAAASITTTVLPVLLVIHTLPNPIAMAVGESVRVASPVFSSVSGSIRREGAVEAVRDPHGTLARGHGHRLRSDLGDLHGVASDGVDPRQAVVDPVDHPGTVRSVGDGGRPVAILERDPLAVLAVGADSQHHASAFAGDPVPED